MSVTRTNNLPKNPAELLAVYTDESYLTEKYAALGNRNFQFVSCNTSGNVTTLHQKREVHSDVPSFAKKLINEWSTVEETWVWTNNGDSLSGALEAAVQGAPVKISGTSSVAADGNGSKESIVMEASVNVPLIGKKLKAKAEEDIADSMAEEDAFNQKYMG